MAKNTFLDFDTVASNNTDISGIGIQGSNAVKNFDDAFRTIMAILRRDLDNGAVYAAKSGNYTAVANDNNAVHRFTAAATLSLTAAATLAADWHYTIIADGGDVTIDPNASELINGATTLRVPDGSYAYVICTGTAFYASVMPATVYGQCRLTKSGSNLLLSRFNGRRLTINGVGEVIPSAGVTLAPTGTPGTVYFIYAYMNSGTMTLEASVTSYVTDTTTGMSVKSGDATRTLVGMAYPVTGPAWQDSATQAFVISYFNRQTKRISNAFTGNQTTSSSSPVEVSTSIRCEFLSWSGAASRALAAGSLSTNTAGVAVFAAIGFDGTTPEEGGCQSSANFRIPINALATKVLGETYHYATLLGWAETTATATYIGNASALGRTSLTVEISG
jgi:hypothetical protein